MKKRFLAVFLALALCLGLMPPAFAASSDFVIKDGVLTKYNGSGGDVVIPDGVTSIGSEAFRWNYNSPTSVTIPNSVTSIEFRAFWNCTNLTSVTISDSMTSIGVDAFYGCTSLTSVTIPDSVTYIGDAAFAGCTSLTSVTIPDSMTNIAGDAFSDTPWLKGQGEFPIVNGILMIYQGDRENLTSVKIPDNVTIIGSRAFSHCESLTSVTIPNSVTGIGGYAFSGCTSLTSVTIPSGVTSIGYAAFWECYSLTSVTIPSSVTSIGESAFSVCDSLTDVYYGGTKAQWEAIDIIDWGNVSLKNATIHYNSVIAKFPDLKPNGFYVDAVDWAVTNGITTGKTATTFAPDLKCSHSEILTFLWRAAGEPESSAKPPISMKGSEFYYKAVKWAAEKGMIGANFNPSAPCNRAYAVQYIWQAMGKPAPTKASPFTDIPAHWSSAKAAAWAAEKGITTGTTATTFNPNGICNRGQIVTFLYRAYK